MQSRYENDFLWRREVLHRATSQLYNKGIKDKIAYHKKQVKTFGDIYYNVFAAVYENQGPKVCIAALHDLADAAVCAKYGWKTIAQWRDEEIAALKNSK